MKQIITSALLFILSANVHGQTTRRLSEKVTLRYHPNIETYFIVEKLAVQHINTYVFDQKDSLYAHQPLVYFAFKQFRKYADRPCVIRISELLQSFRDSLHDNAQIIQYLLSRKPFPAQGEVYPFADSAIFNTSVNPAFMRSVRELTDSLRSFYRFARVGKFLEENRRFYSGSLQEARKDLRPDIFPYVEKFYGESFYQYQLYIMPMMPITYGEDNYRAFGPTIHTPGGIVSAMIFSSSKMLPLEKSLKDYHSFGFNNHEVTRFLTVHEIGHSFVNPHVMTMLGEIDKDTALFTPALRKALEPSYIGDWRVCVIEHFVRLGEIRVAEMMKDHREAERLRKLHIHDFKFVLLPLLEKKIAVYEANRTRYPNFTSFLPELFLVFHSLTPEDVDKLVASLSASPHITKK